MADKEEFKQAHVKYEDLKYLGFVEAAGTLATVCVVRVYEVAKEWSGSTWRHRINEIEGKIKEAVAPLYNLIKGNEHHFLLFFDHKLDVCVCAVHRHAPGVLKGFLDKTVDVARRVPDILVDVSAEVHRVGVVDATRNYFGKAEPIAEEYVRLAWQQFLKIPYSLTVVHVATPPALFVGDKVNKVLSSLKEHNLPLAHYVPLLPLKRIENIIKKEA